MKRRAKKMIVILMVSVILIRPARTEAALPGLFAAVPVAWPVIGGILIAAGVGTATWWATRTPEYRAEVVESVKERLLARGLTLQQQAETAGAIAIAQAGEYIRGVIVDGVSMIATDVIDIVLDVAKDMDITGGYHATVESYAPYTVTVGDIVGSIKYLSPALMASAYTHNWGNDIMYSALVDTLAHIPEASLLFIDSIGNDIYLYYTPIGGIQDKTITGIGYNGVSPSHMYLGLDEDVSTYRMIINRQGAISTAELVESRIHAGYGKPIDSGIVGLGNIGDYMIDQWGATVGELGQAVIDAAGNWTLPGGVETIDTYGDASPVALGEDVIGMDGVTSTWAGDVAFPDSVALPDVAIGAEKAIPLDTTQSIAISGAADVPVPIPTAPELTGSFNQFLVPDWIKSRFPWCIPFDLAAAVEQLQGEPEAPVIHAEFPFFGQVITLHFDFSEFDDVMAILRYGELILFMVALAKGTKDMIQW